MTIDLLEGNVKELKEGLEDETLDLVIETALYEDSTVERFFYKNEEIILMVPASLRSTRGSSHTGFPIRMSCRTVSRQTPMSRYRLNCLRYAVYYHETG